MYYYEKLSNGDNLLMEIYRGGALGSEDAAALLRVDFSTASNVLRNLYGKRLVTRKNVNKHQKHGGPKYSYDLAYDGTRRIEWLMEHRASALA